MGIMQPKITVILDISIFVITINFINLDFLTRQIN